MPRRVLAAGLLCALLWAARAPLAPAEPRPGVDFHEGQAVVRFAPAVADAIDFCLEGERTLTDIAGDPSLQALLDRCRVSGMRRFLPSLTRILRARGERTPARAYWDHVRAVDERFAARKARAPRWSRHVPMYGVFVLFFPPSLPVADACRELGAHPLIEYAEPNPVCRLHMTPNDTYYQSGHMWGVTKIRCETAWDTASGSGVVVAVSDTGVRTSHQDLANRIWQNSGEAGGTPNHDDDGNGVQDDVVGYDFWYDDPTPNDDGSPTSPGVGHGTHCSGTIGAQGNNGTGVIGVAHNCRIMCLKGFGRNAPASTYPAPLASCLQYAASNGADVSSNSWGSASWSTSYATVIANLTAAGVVTVFSAGNDNQDGAHHTPSSNLGLISVAASTPLDGRATFSNHGIPTDVTAPGVAIRSTYNSSDTSYTDMQGTSMAGPHVAGAMAVLVSHRPSLSIEQYRQVLRNAAADVEHPGWDPHAGYGRLDLAAMLAYDVSCVCEAVITSPYYDTPVTGSSVTVQGTAWGPSGYTGYTLAYAPGRAWDADTWTTIQTSSSAVQAGTLGTWDVSSLADGRYTLRLAATNSAGQTFYDRMEVVLDNHSDGSTASAVTVLASPAASCMVYHRNFAPAGDEDWFEMELVSGETYSFRTTNLHGPADTELYLYRSDGTTQVAHNDDYPQGGLKESYISWTCDADGTYYLRCLCWSNAGAGYPPQAGSWDLHMHGLFRDGFENDDTQGSARSHTLARPAGHSIVPAGDADWLSFSAQSGTPYTVACSSFGPDTRVRLFATDGSTQIGSDAAPDALGFYTLSWTCAASGTYYVCVDEDAASPSATGLYTVVVYADEDVLYEEDFTTVGAGLWTALSGTWAVSSGLYRQSDNASAVHFARGGLSSWTSGAVEGVASYRNVDSATTANLGVTLRFVDSDSFYLGRIRANDTVEIARYDNGNMATLASAPFDSSGSTDYHLRLVLDGPALHLFVDGSHLVSAVDRWYDAAGPLALRSFGNESRFDDVRVFRWSATAVTPLAVDDTALPDANVTHAYSQSIPLSGGASPYAVARIAGSLPPGLSLASNGTVSGTPTVVGSYSFDVRVTDAGGRLLGARISVDVTDIDPPVLTVNSPADQDEVPDASLGVDVDASDVSALAEVQVSVNSGAYQDLAHQSGDNYARSVTLQPGWNTLVFRAEDAHGNETVSSSLSVLYDDTPPEVAVTEPADGHWTFHSGVRVEGTSDDAVSVTVNGEAADLDAGTGDWSVELTLGLGANTVTATAEDSHGRTTPASITVHYRMLGDIDDDGDVDEDDALLAAQHEAGLVPLSAMQIACADVDGNGVVDVRDAYAIRRQAAGHNIWED